MKKNYHSNATENELKNGQRFLGIDKQQTINNKPQTTNTKRQTINTKRIVKLKKPRKFRSFFKNYLKKN